MPVKKSVKVAPKKITVKPTMSTKPVIKVPVEPAFSVGHVVESLRSMIRGPIPTKTAAVEVKAIRFDSRLCRKSDVFVALQGEQTHGHDFIAQAAKAGVSAIVCERPRPEGLAEAVTYIEVEDGLLAFRKLTAAWRARTNIPVIAVAGSVGAGTRKLYPSHGTCANNSYWVSLNPPCTAV